MIDAASFLFSAVFPEAAPFVLAVAGSTLDYAATAEQHCFYD